MAEHVQVAQSLLRLSPKSVKTAGCLQRRVCCLLPAEQAVQRPAGLVQEGSDLRRDHLLQQLPVNAAAPRAEGWLPAAQERAVV